MSVEDQLESTPVSTVPDALPYATPSDADSEAGSTPLFQLSSLGLKLIGVFALVQAIPPICALLPSFEFRGMSHFWTYVIAQALPIAGYGGVAVFLFARSAWLSRRLLGDAASISVEQRRGVGVRLQSIGLSVAGAFLALYAVSDLALAVVHYNFRDNPMGSSSPSIIEFFGPAVLRMALGVWLFFGARKLAVLWHRLRTAGHR